MKRACLILFVLAVGITSSPLQAGVTPHGLFTDHMVLQREMNAPVWGTDKPGTTVTVSVAGQTQSTKAADDGKWIVRLTPLEAGGPHTMTIRGSSTVTLTDVLVGDVWVCSGQSNMVGALWSGPKWCPEHDRLAMESATNTQIRLLRMRERNADKPLTNIEVRGGWPQGWAVCAPKWAGGFSGVAMHFVLSLQPKVNVPIGLVMSACGGSPASAWTPMEALKAEPGMKPAFDRWEAFLREYPDPKATYQQKQKLFQQRYKQWRATPPAKRGPQPAFVMPHKNRPAALYNGMIAPLVPLAIKGVIWYQGEQDTGHAYEYATAFSTMIKGWRAKWGQGDFPFLFVQLCDVNQVTDVPYALGGWQILRHQQQKVLLALPKVGMAVSVDAGNGSVHPRNRQPMGRRLALAARGIAYGQEIVYSGPIYEKMTVEGNKVRIHFTHTGSGLVAKGGGELKGFGLAGADSKYVTPHARIDGMTILLWHESIPEPVAACYNWSSRPVGNLFNKDGLPASLFWTEAK